MQTEAKKKKTTHKKDAVITPNVIQLLQHEKKEKKNRTAGK